MRFGASYGLLSGLGRDDSTGRAQEIAQDAAMATVLVIAIAADGQTGIAGQQREQRQQTLRRGRLHLASITLLERRPSRWRDRTRADPREQRFAGGKLG